MKDDYTTSSHYLTYIFPFEKVGRMYFWTWEWQGHIFKRVRSVAPTVSGSQWSHHSYVASMASYINLPSRWSAPHDYLKSNKAAFSTLQHHFVIFLNPDEVFLTFISNLGKITSYGVCRNGRWIIGIVAVADIRVIHIGNKRLKYRESAHLKGSYFIEYDVMLRNNPASCSSDNWGLHKSGNKFIQPRDTTGFPRISLSTSQNPSHSPWERRRGPICSSSRMNHFPAE